MRDLMIIARSRVVMSDLLERFPDLTRRYEVQFERRWHDRRSTHASPREDRRRRERRRLDVREKLRADGWVMISAANRGAHPGE
jgi:hypothetical protein